MNLRDFIKKNRWTLLLMLFTCVGITITGIVFHQDPIRMAPLYVSLTISLMHMRT